jgi:hypothetical protein
MPQPLHTEFIRWLDAELARLKLTDRQLAKKAGVPLFVLHRARYGLMPGWEASAALARALNVPVETVFRKAGLIAFDANEEQELEEWKYLLLRLSPEDRQALLAIALSKLPGQDSGEQI